MGLAGCWRERLGCWLLAGEAGWLLAGRAGGAAAGWPAAGLAGLAAPGLRERTPERVNDDSWGPTPTNQQDSKQPNCKLQATKLQDWRTTAITLMLDYKSMPRSLVAPKGAGGYTHNTIWHDHKFIDI